jgi:hypothetical protein
LPKWFERAAVEAKTSLEKSKLLEDENQRSREENEIETGVSSAGGPTR